MGKSYSTNSIRRSFLDYFVKAGHEEVSSSPLIPDEDPTLLFANSGMVQFKNIFTGAEKSLFSTATTSQKCLRALIRRRLPFRYGWRRGWHPRSTFRSSLSCFSL